VRYTTLGKLVPPGFFIFMTYREKLLDPKWQRKKAQILQRDNFTCRNEKCKSTEITLHVHHLDYIPGINPWDYPDDMLLTLCAVCHDKENERLMLERYLSNSLKMKGFLISDLLSLACKIDTDDEFTATLLKALRNG
jgi:hypothetical protein